MIKCDLVEEYIRDAMEEWLDDYIIQISAEEEASIDPIETALQSVRAQLAQLLLQQENICEYLEKGLYSVDMFTKRNAVLAKEIKKLQKTEAELLQQQAEGDEQDQIAAQFIPAVQHILDNYFDLTIEEQKQVWKLVLKKATVYRSQENELSIQIYPNIPQKSDSYVRA